MNEKICKNCGKEFLPTRHTSWQIFCCKKCTHQFRYFNPKGLEHTCSHCGVTFIPKRKNRITFCSTDCRIDSQKNERQKRLKIKEIEKALIEIKKLSELKVCKYCGKEFNSTNHSRKYCSDSCIKAINREKERDRSKLIHDKTAKYLKCKECGKEFKPEYPSKRRIFCSKECCRKYGNKISKKTEAGRARKAKERFDRRTSFEKVISEKIIPIKVYESHNWVCGICGRKINPKLIHPHLKSASLDHIIPISKGGSHTYDNLQPAHLICNSYKCDKIDNLQLKISVA